jgi:hypothetical protein
VDPNAFKNWPSGPNCFGSDNHYPSKTGSYQLCPSGSTITPGSLSCKNNTGSFGTDGTCSVINATATSAGLDVHANNNCTVGTSAYLIWSCTATSCSVAP